MIVASSCSSDAVVVIVASSCSSYLLFQSYQYNSITLVISIQYQYLVRSIQYHYSSHISMDRYRYGLVMDMGFSLEHIPDLVGEGGHFEGF